MNFTIVETMKRIVYAARNEFITFFKVSQVKETIVIVLKKNVRMRKLLKYFSFKRISSIKALFKRSIFVR
jgi:hypothetical protein